MRPPVDRNFVFSAIALTAALLLSAVALARAITIEPASPVAEPLIGIASQPEIPEAPDQVARVPSEGVLDLQSLELAVDHDPFMPDRTRPASYRLPGELVERTAPVRREEPPAPPFRVIGTAVAGAGGIALVEIENTDAPEVVRVGESLFGYRLQAVETDGATLVGQGQTVRLALEQGTQQPQTSERNSRNSRNNRNAEQAAEAAQQVLDALRARGMSTQMIEQLMGQQLRTGRARGNVTFDGNRITIRRRDTSSVNLPNVPGQR